MNLAAANQPTFGLPGRVPYPNSRPRSIAIVGLGDGGAAIARGISSHGSPQVEVHVLAKSSASDAVAAIKAGGGDLQRDLQSADMIFIVARDGDDVGLAPVVSSIAHSRNHSVTALYIVAPEKIAADDQALRTLRSAAEMLVVASDESYVATMIQALGT